MNHNICYKILKSNLLRVRTVCIFLFVVCAVVTAIYGVSILLIHLASHYRKLFGLSFLGACAVFVIFIAVLKIKQLPYILFQVILLGIAVSITGLGILTSLNTPFGGLVIFCVFFILANIIGHMLSRNRNRYVSLISRYCVFYNYVFIILAVVSALMAVLSRASVG